jgi:hypothetical protein
MTDATLASRPRRLRLSLDGWAVLAALALVALIWANLLPAITW